MISVPSSAGSVAGGSRFSELQQRVLSLFQSVQADAELNRLAAAAINDGIDRINRYNWRKIHGHQYIVVEAGTAEYELNLDFKNSISMHRLNTSDQRDGRIYFKDYAAFEREHQDSTASGTPTLYSVLYDNPRTLVLDVTPDIGFVGLYPQLELRYHRRVPRLVYPADAMGLPPEFDSFVVLHGQMGFALARDPRRSLELGQRAEQAFRELQMDDMQTETDWTEA